MIKKFKPVFACLVFSALFLGAYVLVYLSARSSLIESTYQSVNECLTSNAAEVNSYIDSVFTMAKGLGSESTVQCLYVSELNAKSFSDLIELRRLLNRITLKSRGMLDVILVYDTEKPFAVSSQAIYHDLSSSTLSLADETSQPLLELIRNHTSSSVNRNPTDVITLNTSNGSDEVTMLVFRITKFSGGQLYAVLPVSAKKLLNSVHGTCTYGSPYALIRGEELLYGSWPESDKGEYISVQLPAIGLKAVFRVTEAETTERIRPFTSLLIVLLIVFIVSIVGIIGVIVFSMMVAQRRAEQTKAELMKLDSEARELRQSLDAVSPMLRDTLFHKLLSVGYLSPVERSAFLSYFALKADAPCRITVIGYNALPSASLTEQLQQYIKEKLDPSQAFTVCRGECVIMSLDEIEDAEYSASVKELLRCFVSDEVSAGVSPRMLSVLAPDDAYRLARSALHSASPGDCVIANPEIAPAQAKQLSYAQLNSLYDQIQAGSPNAQQSFETLVKEVLSDDMSGLYRRRTFERFYEDIRALLSRVYSAGGSMPEMELPPFDSSAEQPYVLLGMLRHMLAGAVEQAASRSVNSRNELASAIKLYVDEHIANPNLSLTLLSEEFGMSESAMSRFFKANIGENFAQYMESMRINEAVKLLSSTTLPVSDVAQAVGYASVTTFYKAFKRRTGNSPSHARG